MMLGSVACMTQPGQQNFSLGDVPQSTLINLKHTEHMDITPRDSNLGVGDMGPGKPNPATSSPSSNSTGSDDTPQKRETDPDAIKMFVGQVPKTMDESDLREMFCKFGDIFQLSILRDKATGQHRGCCFVTFYQRKSAIMAQDELHGRHTLPGMHHPIQMKPADNEKKHVEDRKLFIGMINKKLDEEDIKTMFGAFGMIEDCMILRDNIGVSRGCAFVTYALRQSALTAIQHMHHAKTMEGCSSPLVVKFADTQKDKDKPKVLTPNNNILSGNPYAIGAIPNSVPPQYLALLQQSLGMNPMALHAPLSNNIDMTAYQNYHNLQSMGMLGHNMMGLPTMNIMSPLTTDARSIHTHTNGNPNLSIGALQGYQAADPTGQAVAQANQTAAMYLGQQQIPNSPVQGHAAYPAGALPPQMANPTSVANGAVPPQQIQQLSGIEAALSQAYSGIAHYTATFPQAYAPQPAALAPDTPAGKQTEGPDGANLFIYHLPQEFTDMDLLQTFSPFGRVVSAKVFVDKQTNLSKCFGFVSFDNVLSAQAAIQTMNGFQVGMKRLKVQLKKPKNENKPYWYVNWSDITAMAV